MERGKELAEMHWNYIKELLQSHNEESEIISLVEFHYKTAFIHGYKHAIEDMLLKFDNKNEVN